MHTKSIAELNRLLDDGELSSVELTRYFIDRIERFDGALNAFITPTPELALTQAGEADARRRGGERGPMLGVPIAHKDIFCTNGVRTTCGSKMLDNFVAPYDATVVAQFRESGAVMLGKTNMDEFAMGSSNETSYYGPVVNPWDHQRVPGGSSGGAAAAVSAGLAPVGTCTDTGGSIRQPAALSGISGLKPTYGRVSRYGMIAFASSLDQAGIMARSASDIAHAMLPIAVPDPRDSTSVPRPGEDYRNGLGRSVEGLRIGVAKEHFGDGLDPEVGAAVEASIALLQDAGAEVIEISLPNTSLSIPAYYVVAPAEASSNLSRYDGVRFGYRAKDPVDLEDLYKRSRSEGFGPEVRRRILIGTYALSAGYYDAFYLKAQQVRRVISQDFQRAFESVDVIAGPTSPFVAFRLGEKMDDPVTMYLCDINTNAVNLAGLPAISIPCGFSQGLPIGLHLVGNYFEEGRLLNVSHQYQERTDWHMKIPGGYHQ